MMTWTCFEGFFWRSFAKIERIYNFEFIWYSWIRLGPSIPRLLSQTFFLFVSLAVGGERLKFKNLVFFLWKLLPQHVSNLCEPLKKFDEFWTLESTVALLVPLMFNKCSCLWNYTSQLSNDTTLRWWQDECTFQAYTSVLFSLESRTLETPLTIQSNALKITNRIAQIRKIQPLAAIVSVLGCWCGTIFFDTMENQRDSTAVNVFFEIYPGMWKAET